MRSFFIKRCIYITAISLFLLTYGCGTCSTEITFVNNSDNNQEVEITDKNNDVEDIELNPISDSTYYSNYFIGTEIRFKSLFPGYIYKAVDVDHWFGKNHKFYIIIQNDTIRFKDSGNFYWRVTKSEKE